jgi:heat-inducible transcriptional repressor
MNAQRQLIYAQRYQVLNGEDVQQSISGMIDDFITDNVGTLTPENQEQLEEMLSAFYPLFLRRGSIRWTPGLTADEMNLRLMDVSEQVSPQLFLLLSQTIAYATDVLDEASHREIITSGASQLLKLPEFRDADKAHELMSFLTDSKESLPMMDEGPMKILIGPENVSEALKDTSVVIASYDIGDDMRGLIGVVGPTRMDYATVAARLSGFADGLTRLFGKQGLPPKEDTKE